MTKQAERIITLMWVYLAAFPIVTIAFMDYIRSATSGGTAVYLMCLALWIIDWILVPTDEPGRPKFSKETHELSELMKKTLD